MTWIGGILLAFHALAVVRKPGFREVGLVRVKVERIGQHDAIEGLIGTLGSACLQRSTLRRQAPAVKRLLDVDGRDVVGEQDDLVGVKLFVVLPFEIGVPDERGLDQPDEKDARAGERIQDVNALVAQAPAEFLGATRDRRCSG